MSTASGKHSYETADLRELETALTQLQGHCSDVRAHAAGAGTALSGTWSGLASAEFITTVQTWQVGAFSITDHANFLAQWAGHAATSYEDAQSAVGRMWGGGGGGGGGGSTPVAV